MVRALERDAPGRWWSVTKPAHFYALHRQMTTPRVRCQAIALAPTPAKPGPSSGRPIAARCPESSPSRPLATRAPGRLDPRGGARCDRPCCAGRCRQGSPAKSPSVEQSGSCVAVCISAVAIGHGPIGDGSTATRGRTPAEQMVVDEYVLALDHAEGRLHALNVRLHGDGHQRSRIASP